MTSNNLIEEVQDIILELKGLGFQVYEPKNIKKYRGLNTYFYATKDNKHLAYVQWDKFDGLSVSAPIRPSKDFGSSLAMKYSHYGEEYRGDLTVIEAVKLASQPKVTNWLGEFDNYGIDLSKFREI